VADPADPVAELVAGALSRRRPERRAEFLRQLIAYAAAGLTVLEGDRAASETLYRTGDAVATHRPS
jgi:hypothetical protein